LPACVLIIVLDGLYVWSLCSSKALFHLNYSYPQKDALVSFFQCCIFTAAWRRKNGNLVVFYSLIAHKGRSEKIYVQCHDSFIFGGEGVLFLTYQKDYLWYNANCNMYIKNISFAYKINTYSNIVYSQSYNLIGSSLIWIKWHYNYAI
jgi:hypothetical protein